MPIFTSGRHSSEAYEKDGVWYWRSNDSVIMLDVCRHHGIPYDPAKQEAARDAYVSASLSEYRANQGPASAEELYEMRANFGPGKVVVDVVTGRRTVT